MNDQQTCTKVSESESFSVGKIICVTLKNQFKITPKLFQTNTVKIVEFYLMETRIMAKIKYFPNRGTTSDVGGIISTTSKKNT